MSRSARGPADEPGRTVAAKSKLNKAMLDQGWGTFRRMLEYKQRWRGPRRLRSRRGATPARNARRVTTSAKENRPQQALFLCVACGYANHADVVGAINIDTLALGHRER